MHIGRRIKDVMQKERRSPSWLASKIPCARQNVYHIFSRENIDIHLLSRISQLLDHDFFSELSSQFQQLRDNKE